MSTRNVGGGYVNAKFYPDAGEPDWKAEAQRWKARADELARKLDALEAKRRKEQKR